VARPATQFRTTIQRAAPPLLIILAVALILVGKADQRVFAALRTTLADDAAPLLAALSRPLDAATALVAKARGVVAMYEDNRRLERDNARLLAWQQAALRLAADNRELRRLLKVVPDKALSYVTARVIANSGGGFVRSLLIDAGGDRGLTRGQAAIAGAGLVGRLTGVGNRAARVLLITDLNSRIPVMVAGSHVRAVLAGDNSARPQLLYAEPADAVKIGDRIATSGDGGVFPPGLPVGVVAGFERGLPRVEPYVALSQLEYVMVVDYGLSAGLPQPAAAARPARRGARFVPDEAGVR
jgi:rod shape-determining protein MreC